MIRTWIVPPALGLAALVLGMGSREAAAMADGPADGLTPAWTAEGTFGGVGADRSGRMVFALGVRGECAVLDPKDGSVTRRFKTDFGGPGRTVRVARLGDDKLGLVVFGTWTKGVVLSAGDGSKLWDEGSDDAVDDMAVADLDGDGRDEVIVGYNGEGGLHVFDADGKRRWRRGDLGNVWHVAAADLDGDGHPKVVSTSARGLVHVTDARDGRPIAEHQPGGYADVVGVAPGAARPPARGDLLLANAMRGRHDGALSALGPDGRPTWTTPTGMAMGAMEPSPDGKLVAAVGRNGRVLVVRVADGRVVAERPGALFAAGAGVAWATRDRPEGPEPLLLVTMNSAVTAYQVRAEPDPAPAPR